MNPEKLPKILGYRVLFRPTGPLREFGSMIEVPETAGVRENEGVVVALGDGRIGVREEYMKFSVSVGDRVLVSNYGGVDMEVQGERCRIVAAEDILAIL